MIHPTTCEWTRSFGTYGSGSGQLDRPLGIAVGPNGDIFVCERGNHRVQVFDQFGTSLRIIGRRGSQNGEFLFPWGLTIDKNGVMVVVDTENNRIQLISSTGTFPSLLVCKQFLSVFLFVVLVTFWSLPHA